MSTADSLPDDIATLKRLVLARDAELARARAEASSAEALIAHLRLAIEKMRRELYGQRSERKAHLLDQMELKLEELEADAAEDVLAAREFCRIRPNEAIFTPAEAANSMLCREIPDAMEQGIL